MAWQTVPSLLIIGVAFNAAAGLCWGLDRLYYGRVSGVGSVDESVLAFWWSHNPIKLCFQYGHFRCNWLYYLVCSMDLMRRIGSD